MIKVPILHNNSDKQDLIKRYYLALIPLILFSFYKNGILLYKNDLINFSKALIPLYFYIISILTGFIVSKILKDNIKENVLICLIISCTISINTNIMFYSIILFASLFIGKVILNKVKLKFNIGSFIRIIIILSLLLNAYSYLNIGEKLNKFNYNLFDIFSGFGIGGIANTSTLILLISLIILSSSKYYKKVIAISSSTAYIIINLVYIFLTKNYDNLNLILNGINYFSFIFIASDLYITPYSKNGMFIYGITIGIITSILNFIGLKYEASYVGILIASLFIPLINRINNKKYLKNNL